MVYIPLDNRPVNIDRAQYLAQASGIELIVPDLEYYSNTLNNDADTTTNCSDQGNPEELLNWLKTDPDVQLANNFVISLDMLFSGGLVGSRAPFFDTDDSIATQGKALGSYTLSAKEQEIIDYLEVLCAEKNVVLFDTVMRLASTVGYADLESAMYGFLRNQYAFAARPTLSGSNLTVNNIVANYKYGANGQLLSTDYTDSEGNYYQFADAADTYLRARERKLRITDALYSRVANTAQNLFIGVDDSVPQSTIHNNEINYIKTLIDGDKSILFAGADELGLVGLSNAVTRLHGNITVNLKYYGGYENFAADDYDYESLDNSVRKHITAVGGVVSSNNNGVMDILVLTRDGVDLNSGSADADVANLIAQLKTNIYYGVPTCIIDGSGYKGYGRLADAILAISNNYGIANVLGFSAWNTAGNAIGISLANATARCSYLANVDNITTDSHYGFLKSITYSYVKDDAYKKAGGGNCMASPSYFYNNAEPWVAGINNSGIITKIVNGSGTTAVVGDVRVSNLKFPWNRDFEADFDIAIISATGANMIAGTNSGIENDFSGDWWWSNPYVGTTNDTNTHPWSMLYTTNLVDGVWTNTYVDKATALKNWYGIRYHVTAVDANGKPTEYENNNASSSNGILNMPSIEFATPRDIDKLRINFLFKSEYSIYLPEKVEVTFVDANGHHITKVADTGVRKAENVLVSEDSNYWFTLDEVVEDVKLVMIRPYAMHLKDKTINGYTFPIYGWAMMDEIEIYSASTVIDNDGSAN